MNTEKYLSRIGMEKGPLTAETLKALQRMHYREVPYENIDILLAKPLSLDPESLYEKMITRGRGGYCFELNGLYGELLKALGFRFTERLGRFLRGEAPGFIPMGRHRILLVELGEQRFVCDVGIGCPTPTEALELVYDKTQSIAGTDYRFARDQGLKNILEYRHHGKWEPYFSFGDDENFPSDFIAPSTYCELSPDSVFNKGCMAHIFTETGRVSLEGCDLKRFSGKEVRVETLETSSALKKALFDVFHIAVSEEEAELLFAKSAG